MSHGNVVINSFLSVAGGGMVPPLFFIAAGFKNPAELDSVQCPLEGYKYLGYICSFTISNIFSALLFFIAVFKG